jgi:hypothetical protein
MQSIALRENPKKTPRNQYVTEIFGEKQRNIWLAMQTIASKR